MFVDTNHLGDEINMISAASVRSFNSPPTMKERFESEKARVTEKNSTIEKLETLADTFLSLDQSKYDQDDAPGSVAFGDDKGTLAYVTASPLGGAMSFDYLKESKNGGVEEYSISMGLTGTVYSQNINGVTTEVYQDGNGLLTLMEVVNTLSPEKGEKPEKGDGPDKSEPPKDGGKPEGSEKPKESGKPKKPGKPKKS